MHCICKENYEKRQQTGHERTRSGIPIRNQHGRSHVPMLHHRDLDRDKTGISWMMIPFFFIGALAGFTNIYKMARKLIEKDSRDDRYVKKDK